MFKPLLFVSAIVALGVTASFAAGPSSQRAASAAGAGHNSAKPTAQSLARAKQIYQYDCAICHGANGNGKTDLAQSMQMTLNDWTDAKTLAGQSDADLFKIIRNGKGQMPPEPAGRAEDGEVRSLIYYIRGMAILKPAAASK